MPVTDGQSVEREIRIAARPEAIFPFFTDPARMVRWKGVEAELDPRPGGIYRVNVTGRDVARGQYVAIEPFRRVVFTWGWEGDNALVPPGASTVEVTFIPDGDATIVRLVHRDLPVAEAPGFAEGWDHFLPRLGIVAAGGNPGPDPWVST
jgi:uncharacterized protein YndB with AHSA1/START domain